MYLCIYFLLSIKMSPSLSSGIEELLGAHPGVLYDPDWSVTDQFLAVVTHQHHTVDTKRQIVPYGHC